MSNFYYPLYENTKYSKTEYVGAFVEIKIN